MVLEEYAFANMSSSNEFVLNLLGNIVTEIPTHTFQNTVANMLMLNNMGIEKIHDDAFNGLSFERTYFFQSIFKLTSNINSIFIKQVWS